VSFIDGENKNNKIGKPKKKKNRWKKGQSDDSSAIVASRFQTNATNEAVEVELDTRKMVQELGRSIP
jgi:hypothetical protein